MTLLPDTAKPNQSLQQSMTPGTHMVEMRGNSAKRSSFLISQHGACTFLSGERQSCPAVFLFPPCGWISTHSMVMLSHLQSPTNHSSMLVNTGKTYGCINMAREVSELSTV